MALIFPNDIPSKANPTTSDLLLISDQADNSELKKITIWDITTDIGAGLIVDGSASLTTTYSSNKINTLNGAQDTTISGLATSKLTRNWQLRTWNGAWKTIYNDGSGNEVELALWTAGYVLNSNGASAAPTWVAPSADIVGQTEATDWDMDNDVALIYEASAAANRKQKINVYRATDAEALAWTVTNKFITPAQIWTLARKIYVDVVPAGTSITTSLTTCYTQTIPANTFTANSQMVVRASFSYGGASSWDATVNVKFGWVTILQVTGIGITATGILEIELTASFDATTWVCNVTAKKYLATTIATTITANVSTASLTSNQTFTIDWIRTGSGWWISYYTSSMYKI